MNSQISEGSKVLTIKILHSSSNKCIFCSTIAICSIQYVDNGSYAYGDEDIDILLCLCKWHVRAIKTLLGAIR